MEDHGQKEKQLTIRITSRISYKNHGQKRSIPPKGHLKWVSMWSPTSIWNEGWPCCCKIGNLAGKSALIKGRRWKKNERKKVIDLIYLHPYGAMTMIGVRQVNEKLKRLMIIVKKL